MKEAFEPVTKSIEDVSQNLTKTMTEAFEENNKALLNLGDKLLEITNDRGILARCLLALLFKITYSEFNSQFTLVKDPSSNRVNVMLINKTIPVNLYNNFLMFRDADKEFDIQGDLLRVITKKN